MSLEIKNGMFCDLDSGRFPLFLFNRDRDETEMPHNAVMYGISGIKGKNCPFDDDLKLKSSWKEKCRGDLRSFKKQGVYVLIQPFSALWFRKQASGGRATGIENTIWWRGSLNVSREYFFNEYDRQQQELFEFMIDFCQTIKLKFAFSLLWEAQTIAWYGPSFEWFRAHKEWLKRKYGNNFPVGYHTHNAKQSKLADFLSLEGNGIDELIHEPGDKPVMYFGKNPGRWPVKNRERYEVGYNTKKLIPFVKKETISELVRHGCSAKLYDRWLLEKILKGDLPEGFDLSQYDFRDIEREMREFYGVIADRLKTADRTKITNLFCFDLIEESDLTPAPKPKEDKEKYKKTEPLEIVEPVKEKNRMNRALKSLGCYLGRWWHTLTIIPLMMIINAINPAWYVAAGAGVVYWWFVTIAEYIKNRVRKTAKERIESGKLKPGDPYFPKPKEKDLLFTVNYKSETCPGG